jgi:hypothetical protein
VESIKRAIERGELPQDKLDVLGPLIGPEGTYEHQEGLYWDFKAEWPFSYSDGYFGGIARLICAFANTHGGIIIFGVHDQTRSPGHNKVSPNMDRLQLALKQLLSDPPDLILKRYDEGKQSAVDVLLVRSLQSTKLPLRFLRSIEKYRADVIWVRQGPEVLQAEPRHIATLYCRSSAEASDTDHDAVSGGLPPSAATIKRFVGRMKTIDQVFGWLKFSDEPRTFLYGKGGSGKTTIAYEVAKVIKAEGAHTKVGGGEVLDNVIFVTAKQRTMNVLTQSAESFVGLDFSTERELYEAILTLGNWTSEPLGELSLDSLKSEIRSFFDLTANFVVIDDIDTLTTKGQEAGFDFLYGILWRSKRRSKLLYTIRNAPTQSLANSIEVPGLEERDYEEFVSVCADQFKVPPPDTAFVAKTLSAVSERRPLVLESIIALRRTSGSYDRAVQLFEEGAGEDVRGYVFRREWNALPADNRGRYLLAVLALHGEPLAFTDLAALTRYEELRVQDALAQIREMFLQVNEVGEEATFQLGALTRAFVVEQSKKLDLYPSLRERVEKYKRNFYPENPLLSRLRDRVEALLSRGNRLLDGDAIKQACTLVMDPTLPPKISEDPRFISLQAHVNASQTPPRIDDARRLFGHVISMKFEPDVDHLKTWFLVERNSGYGVEECIKIADFVSRGKKYGDDEKIWFLSRKATQLYTRGRSEIYFSPSRAIQDLGSALTIHLACFYRNFESGSTKTEKSDEYARNTAYFLFHFLVSNALYDNFFEILRQIGEAGANRWDPIEDPLSSAIQMMKEARGGKGELSKLRARLDQLRRSLGDVNKWYDRFACERILSCLADTSATLSEKIQQAR